MSRSPLRPRIKVCGITRPEDGQACAALGADAIGLVFYPPSPRAVTVAQAQEVVAALPPFVTVVALFVDPTVEEVNHVLQTVPIDVLQFHGDEPAAFCRQFHRPYLKAVRVQPGLNLLHYASLYPDARALLTDAYQPGVPGGTGHRFDWSLLPESLPLPLILSGGLDPDNIALAVAQVKPAAVDVSSGVEAAKGIKDAAKVAAFIAGACYAPL